MLVILMMKPLHNDSKIVKILWKNYDDYNGINSMMTAQMINGGNVANAEAGATDNDQLIDISWRNARWRNLSENWSFDCKRRKRRKFKLLGCWGWGLFQCWSENVKVNVLPLMEHWINSIFPNPPFPFDDSMEKVLRNILRADRLYCRCWFI